MNFDSVDTVQNSSKFSEEEDKMDMRERQRFVMKVHCIFALHLREIVVSSWK